MPPDYGYLPEVAYVRQFCAELSPVGFRAIAALAGCPPPKGNDFTYCEIGSGFGDTLLTLAAGHPSATFVGVDLNPTHVAAARRLAERGALANVRVLEGDFEDLDCLETSSLDYAVAHGFLSWVTPSKRKTMFERAAAWLKPGGLLYLGYNALPGWASVAPLRRFLLEAATTAEGSLEVRIRFALDLAKRLCDGRGQYFIDNPSSKEILSTAIERGVAYAAHEFFNPHWQPMYFADVAAEAHEHDFRFVGQLPLHLNYRDLATPPSLTALLPGLDHRLAWEHARAFAANEFFRRDVYVKGAVPRGPNVSHAYLDATPFGTLVPLEHVKREIALPSRTLDFSDPQADAVLRVLARRSSTVAELTREPTLLHLGLEAIRETVLRLAMGPDVLPMARPARAPIAQTLDALRFWLPSAFNRAVLMDSLSTGVPRVLASPVAGTGVGLSTLQAVALRALTEATPETRAVWLRSFVETTPLRMHDHGRRIDDKKGLADALEVQVEEFRAARLGKLVELGIVEAVREE